MTLTVLEPIKAKYRDNQILAATSLNGFFAAIYLLLLILFRAQASAFGPLTVFLLDMVFGYLLCVYLELRLLVHTFIWLLAFAVNCALSLAALLMATTAVFFEESVLETYELKGLVKEQVAAQKFFDWKIAMAIIGVVLFILGVS